MARRCWLSVRVCVKLDHPDPPVDHLDHHASTGTTTETGEGKKGVRIIVQPMKLILPNAPLTRFRLKEATFELPLPPSENEMYTPISFRKKDGSLGTRFISSRKLRDWQHDAGYILLSQGIYHPDWARASVLGCDAWVYVPSRRSDVLNRLKATLDLIATVLGFNDNKFETAHVDRRIDKANPRIEITLYILELRPLPPDVARPHSRRKGKPALAGNR